MRVHYVPLAESTYLHGDALPSSGCQVVLFALWHGGNHDNSGRESTSIDHSNPLVDFLPKEANLVSLSAVWSLIDNCLWGGGMKITNKNELEQN